MNTDRAAILRRIEKEKEAMERRLEQLKILSDPDMLALAEELLGSHADSVARDTKEAQPDERSVPQRSPSTSEESRITKIRRLVAEIEGEFTVGTVAERAGAGGLNISPVAIGKDLQRLAKTGEIEVVTRRKGSPGNSYVKTPKLFKWFV